MPPKPRIAIPTKTAPIVKVRAAPPPNARPATRTPPNPQASRTTAPPQPEPRKSWRQDSNLRFNARWTFNILMTGCALIWVRDHFVFLTPIQGASMAPTINPTVHETGKKDWLVIRPLVVKAAKPKSATEDRKPDPLEIQRGDVVTFWKSHKPEEAGIKRVIALEGDTVYPYRGYAHDAGMLARRRLVGFPDGLPDQDEDSILAGREEVGKVVVPYGHVWLEGDNARNSLDSRESGPISKSLIEGKAVLIWRGWTQFLKVGDERSERDKKLGSRVVEGKAVVPDVFLE
ncbi:LexA/Signal peptidase [Setomelanomma holmii]|uniref:Mitochondrial inner membrane protease subunit n=1 Tax=Setomelanomma holmii TaxID=210430 RepID=A0A9P4GWU3_9PLEO|nr:LexA/Signal peptidase [Setomelanomma holmii]